MDAALGQQKGRIESADFVNLPLYILSKLIGMLELDKQEQAMGHVFDIDIVHYVGDGIWVATSDDIKGLTVETDSLESFIETLIDVSSELLSHNHDLTDAEIEAATLEVKSLRPDTDRPNHSETRPHPKLHFTDVTALASAA